MATPEAAPTGHPKSGQARLAMALSCLGLMADMYDINVINLVRPSLQEEFGRLSPGEDALLSSAPLAGAVVGQLLLGALADRLGRRRVFVATAGLIGVSSLACALVPSGWSSSRVFRALGVCRFFLGIGIGGEYPLAAASAVENSDAASSSQSLVFVLAGMVLGCMLGPIAFIIFSGPMQLDSAALWRFAFGFGAAMAFALCISRGALMQETTSFRAAQEATRAAGDAAGNIEAAASAPGAPARGAAGGAGPAEDGEAAGHGDSAAAALWAMRWSLLGTAGAWFLYNIMVYSVGLFSTTIFDAAPGLESAKVVLVINAPTVPATVAAWVLSRRMRMKDLQMLGFGLMALCFAAESLLCDSSGFRPRAFVPGLCLYAAMSVLNTMGPGLGTFAVPGQIYPTRIRGTAHGLSSACGKMGAVTGTVMFPYIETYGGQSFMMGCMALFTLGALAWTVAFLPSYGVQELEAIAHMDGNTPLVHQAMRAEEILHKIDKAATGEALPFARDALKEYTH